MDATISPIETIVTLACVKILSARRDFGIGILLQTLGIDANKPMTPIQPMI